jgi:gamma-glutamylputrescine oxidase
MDILTANDKPGTYPNSWYAATARTLKRFAPARGEVSCDVCIIGGGFTGLSAALHLAGRGFDVALVEAHRVGFGASGRNGGQIHTGQRLDQEALEKMVGTDTARALWELGLESVELAVALAAEHAPEANYVPGLLHADHKRRFVSGSHAYARHLCETYGYTKIRPVEFDEMRHLVGSTSYHGGTLDMGGGHLHPLRYALGLARAAIAKGVRIFEETRVEAVEPGTPATIRTSDATIRAGHVLWACNGYLGHAERRTARRVMPINNYIIATEPLEKETAESLVRNDYAVADSRFVINYFRLSEDRRMLFGGGESYFHTFPKDIAALVSKPMLQVFPQLASARIEYAWGGTLGITLNRMPHFARLSGNILTASGYSGHGVAMATLGGKLAAEAIAGQAEKFDLMASVPTPEFPGGTALRWPLLVAGMLWFSLRDRL